MTTATMNQKATSPEARTQSTLHRPDHLPAYARTGSPHSGMQPFEAQTRLMNFMDVLTDRDMTEARQLSEMLFQEGDPLDNASLSLNQAKLVAKLARRFDREGDTFARDSAELALNASDLMLDQVRPHTVAESMQADREGRRMQELRSLLTEGGTDELPL